MSRVLLIDMHVKAALPADEAFITRWDALSEAERADLAMRVASGLVSGDGYWGRKPMDRFFPPELGEAETVYPGIESATAQLGTRPERSWVVATEVQVDPQ